MQIRARMSMSADGYVTTWPSAGNPLCQANARHLDPWQ
jgi:hypothetical protein